MGRDKDKVVFLPTVDISDPGIADANGILQHGLKHRLKIAGKTVYNVEHFRGSRLLLPSLVQFAGEPSDLCILDMVGRGHILDASRRFVFSASRPRALDVLPPALERGFIASP